MSSLFDNDLSRPLDTPFSKTFLEGGHRLSPADLRVASKVIVEGERRIVDLDSAIAHAKFELERMAHARVVIQGQVARHKNATRAFRRLPPEIVGKILIEAAPVSDPDDVVESPWYLGHICQYWREVAISVPILWSEICIMHRREPFPLLETLLSRCSSGPLKVLYWSTSKPDPCLLRMLVEQSERWTFASLLVNPENFGELAPICGRIPQLRHLRIEVVAFWSPESKSKVHINPFEIAPALCDISFDDLSGLSYPLIFPWSQLTRFKGTGRSPKLLASLQRMPNLELASLTLEGESFVTSSPTPITLPRLHRLFVSDLEFLNSLTLPALDDLYMISINPGPLLALLQHSQKVALRTLRVIFCNPPISRRSLRRRLRSRRSHSKS